MRLFRVVFIALVALWGSMGMAAAQQTSDEHEYVNGVNQFNLQVFGQLGETPGNMFVSAYSIHTALGMAMAGAQGQTLVEMRQALEVEAMNSEAIHRAAANITAALSGNKEEQGFELRVANSFWGLAGYPFRASFLEFLNEHYAAELYTVDFRNDSEGAREEINEWVEDATNNKINDLIKPGMLQPLTRLVLVNAVYFLGDWLQPFTAESTRDRPFHLVSGEIIEVPTMGQQLWTGYGEVDTVQVLELEYMGGRLSMIILLPEQNGLDGLEERMDAAYYDRLVGSMESQEVVLNLPKWESTSEFQLAEVLSGLGMHSAFDPDAADFTAMAETDELFISDVVHKTFVRVDELGTEAAAATAVMMAGAGAPMEPPKEFRADRPFLYLIRDKVTGLVLFMGRMTDPRE